MLELYLAVYGETVGASARGVLESVLVATQGNFVHALSGKEQLRQLLLNNRELPEREVLVAEFRAIN